MSEGLPIVDFLRAFFYAFALRRAGGFLPLHLVILPLSLSAFRQALAADPVEYAFVDVIIDRLFADLRFEGQPQPSDFSDDGGGGIAFFADLLFDEGGLLVIVDDLQFADFGF